MTSDIEKNRDMCWTDHDLRDIICMYFLYRRLLLMFILYSLYYSDNGDLFQLYILFSLSFNRRQF